MFDKPKRHMSKNSMRNMRQYQGMSDEEFDNMYANVVYGKEKDEIVLERFDRLMKEFENEYDLTELLPNDRVVLRNLINSMLQLEDYEIQLRQLSSNSAELANNIVVIDRLSSVCDRIKDSISKMQSDLGITRKVRKSDKDQNVLAFLEDLKKKAAQFSQEKYRYVFCEKCGELLATVWYLDQDSNKNKITVHCTRKTEDNEICNWSKTLTAKELTGMGGSNQMERLPDSMK